MATVERWRYTEWGEPGLNELYDLSRRVAVRRRHGDSAECGLPRIP